MTRTTIGFEPGLLRQLKLRAAEHDETLQKTINDLLRQALSDRKPAPYKLNLGVIEGPMNPDLDICDRDSIDRVLGGRRG